MSETGSNMTAPYNLSMGYLRAFVTLLVLFHHSVLAYYSRAPQPGIPLGRQPMLWAAFPVVDPQRWPGFDLMVGFNDIFFMSLMFLVSGLFVQGSLERKGSLRFVGGRILRLGIPFAVAAGLLAPLAYCPAYLQSGADPSLAAYWQTWTSLPYWPSGPAWFIWVLLTFGSVAAFINLIAPGWLKVLGRLASGADRHPWKFFFGLCVLSAGAYVTLSIVYNPYRWLSYGPFTVQASRMLHYAIYFFAGASVGAYGLDRGLLARDGKLARRWWLLAGLAVPIFIALVAVVIAAGRPNGPPLLFWETVGGISFALSCGISSFALIAFFVRFLRWRAGVFDSLARNAYRMYVVHYTFVPWIQFALLPARLGGLQKGLIVFCTVVMASWATTALLRRIPAVAKIL